MTAENPGLSILIAFTSIGDLLEYHLKQREVLVSSQNELAARSYTTTIGHLNSVNDLERAMSSRQFTLRAQLSRVETLLDHGDLNSLLKEPLQHLHKRLAHLVEHGLPLRDRQEVKPLKDGTLRQLAPALLATRHFVAVLETGADAYDRLCRAKVSNLQVRQQRQRVIDHYEDMEANFIDAVGCQGEKAELEKRLSDAETAFVKARIEYARVLLQVTPAHSKLQRLIKRGERLPRIASQDPTQKSILAQIQKSSRTLLHEIQRKECECWDVARMDLRDYLFMEATDKVRRFRRERALVRDTSLHTLDSELYELLKKPS